MRNLKKVRSSLSANRQASVNSHAPSPTDSADLPALLPPITSSLNASLMNHRLYDILMLPRTDDRTSPYIVTTYQSCHDCEPAFVEGATSPQSPTKPRGTTTAVTRNGSGYSSTVTVARRPPTSSPSARNVGVWHRDTRCALLCAVLNAEATPI